MRYENIILAALFLATHAGAEIIVGSQELTFDAYPGRYTETVLRIRNNLNYSVLAVVGGSEGELRDLIALDNTRLSLEPVSEGDLKIRFYVYHRTDPGTYYGEIMVTTGNTINGVPVALNVLDVSKSIKLNLTSTPYSSIVRPGELLKIQSDIVNPEETEIVTHLEVFLINPETGGIVAKTDTNISVTTVVSRVSILDIPDDIPSGEYKIQTSLSVYGKDNTKTTITLSDSVITIKPSLMDSMTNYVQSRFTRSNIQRFLSMLIILLIISAYIVHLIRDARKRKIYLESIDFGSLPKPSTNAGFIGRVAETKIRTFIDFNQLQTHTLCAGATGSGKTIATQIIVEEALLKGISVIVFDPTAQWTGFLRPCKTKGMLRLYPHFRMNKKHARAFNGNIRTIDDPSWHLKIREYLKPGEINIFCLHKLQPKQIDQLVENTIKDIIHEDLDEHPSTRLLIVYDEVHRLLPKFGGSGKGFIQIERGVREFRKWGVGLVLISQVLSDFIGEIKANIGTEIQMRTRYEKDLERIKMKYGKDTQVSVVRARVGTGMIQNSQYNKGKPYFISLRPSLHDPHRLGDEEIDKYERYNRRISKLKEGVKDLEATGVDIFDFEIEIDLAITNLKNGSFDIIDLYLESLEPRLEEEYRRLDNEVRKKVDDMRRIRREELKKFEEGQKRFDKEVEERMEKFKTSIESEEKKVVDFEKYYWGKILDEQRNIAAERDKTEEWIKPRQPPEEEKKVDKGELEKRATEIREKVEGVKVTEEKKTGEGVEKGGKD